uniref:Gustatory receptor n=1 Tax=Anopheles albimanus TaxID=7167 RepID=A0A1Y9G892_ANOAL
MSSFFQCHSRLFSTASVVYFISCSYNSQTGRFEAQNKNLLSFALSILIAVPFWLMDIQIMDKLYIRTMSPVLATVAILELAIYISLAICAILNVFVNRRRITKLMNVVFRFDWLLDRSDGSFDDRYNDNRRFVGVISLALVLFCYKLTEMTNSVANFTLAMLTFLRFLATCLTVFVHRLCVRAIAWRMVQLQELYCSSLVQLDHQLLYFLKRFDRYYAQMANVDRCFSLPILLVFLLVMVELVYLLYECYLLFMPNDTTSMVDKPADYINWIMYQMWQMQYALLSYLTISACRDATIQVEETARCTRYFDDYRLQNTRAAKQVQKFLLKNLHQKKKFSACGFFDIDNTVIYMVFSSIVTYLVILIQFKQLENDLTQPVPYNGTANGTTEAP